MYEFDDDRPLEDWEYPDESDDNSWDDDDPELLPCPECGEGILEDSEQCPYCGQYVTFSTAPWTGRSTVWLVVGALGVIATIVALLVW